jgi:hypothetical protein
MYDPIINASNGQDNHLMVELSTEIEGLDIYYTFDNTFPDNFYPKYKEPIIAPNEAFSLKVITYRDGKTIREVDYNTNNGIKNKGAKKRLTEYRQWIIVAGEQGFFLPRIAPIFTDYVVMDFVCDNRFNSVVIFSQR